MQHQQMKRQRQHQSGFTLVEIAIVLVIVGLLIGAVLKGQEMIFNTKVKATYNMVREFTAAVNSYQDRYHALPGDDSSAATRFPGAATLPTNGNGNGLIAWTNANCAAGVQANENCQAFYHLRLANFITGNGSQAPESPFGVPVGLTYSSQLITGGGSTHGLFVNGLTTKAMSAIDTAFDDGVANTGSTRCQNLAAYNLVNPDLTIAVWCQLGTF